VIRRSRSVVPACLLAAVFVATGCGSRLTKSELLSVTRQEGAGTPAATDQAAAIPQSPAPVQSGEATAPVGSDSTPVASAVGSGVPVPATSRPGSPTQQPSTAVAGNSRATAPAAGAPAASGKPTASTTPKAQSAAAPGGPAAVASDGSPIKLGSIGTFSGVLGAAMYPGLQAAQAWTAYINAKGGLGAHPVQLVVRNRSPSFRKHRRRLST
jgi:branched-chain amino acid transport system substrate-binding protein